MNRRIALIGALVLALALMTSLSLMAKPSDDCQLSNGGCRAFVSTSVYTGPPPIPICLIGVPLVQVDVTISCKAGGGGSTTAVRCGALSDPVIIDDGGTSHIIYPDDGYDWEDALDDCSVLVYKKG
jgi:hypothetical protein